jgi:hypothetical protein
MHVLPLPRPPGTLIQKTLIPVPSRSLGQSSRYFQVILISVLVIGGHTWQALDHEAFPDESLPHWFVQLFR